MTMKGSTLGVNQSLALNDYLYSDNQCFQLILGSGGNLYLDAQGNPGYPPRYLWNNGVNISDGQPYVAVMQSDGNFVVYRETIKGGGDVVWATNTAGPVGQYVAVMQSDGNFVVYRGTTPSAGNAIWATNTNVFNIARVDVSNLTYDLAHAVLSNPQLAAEFTQILTNRTKVQQSETFAFECDYQETQKWSTTWGVKVGTSLSLQNVPIPIIGTTGNLGLSAEGSWSTTTDMQQQETKKYTETVPVLVPPHSKVTCRATVTTAGVSVPFSANATFWDTSGKPFFGLYKGTYQGTTAYQLQTSFT